MGAQACLDDQIVALHEHCARCAPLHLPTLVLMFLLCMASMSPTVFHFAFVAPGVQVGAWGCLMSVGACATRESVHSTGTLPVVGVTLPDLAPKPPTTQSPHMHGRKAASKPYHTKLHTAKMVLLVQVGHPVPSGLHEIRRWRNFFWQRAEFSQGGGGGGLKGGGGGQWGGPTVW